MRCPTCLKVLLGFTLGGTLFSGYISGVKLFSDTCAFGESCPYFLGYPSCYYGFAMFVALLVVTVLALARTLEENDASRWLLGISALGIVFAGYFTIGELPLLLSDGLAAYMLGLPTCALGLIFYLAIFVIALRIFLVTRTRETPIV